MKKFSVVRAVLFGLVAASAAGTAASAQTVFDWSRCHVGVHVGYGWGKDNNDFGLAVASDPTECCESFPQEFGPFNHTTSGLALGAQGGCDYRLRET